MEKDELHSSCQIIDLLQLQIKVMYILALLAWSPIQSGQN
jgi:hypothetical protein